MIYNKTVCSLSNQTIECNYGENKEELKLAFSYTTTGRGRYGAFSGMLPFLFNITFSDDFELLTKKDEDIMSLMVHWLATKHKLTYVKYSDKEGEEERIDLKTHKIEDIKKKLLGYNKEEGFFTLKAFGQEIEILPFFMKKEQYNILTKDRKAGIFLENKNEIYKRAFKGCEFNEFDLFENDDNPDYQAQYEHLIYLVESEGKIKRENYPSEDEYLLAIKFDEKKEGSVRVSLEDHDPFPLSLILKKKMMKKLSFKWTSKEILDDFLEVLWFYRALNFYNYSVLPNVNTYPSTYLKQEELVALNEELLNEMKNHLD